MWFDIYSHLAVSTANLLLLDVLPTFCCQKNSQLSAA